MLERGPIFAEYRTSMQHAPRQWLDVIDRLESDPRMGPVWSDIEVTLAATDQTLVVLKAVMAAFHKAEYFPQYAKDEEQRAKDHKKVVEAIATLSEFFARYADDVHPQILRVRQSLSWAGDFSGAINDAAVLAFRKTLPLTRKRNSAETTFCKMLCQEMQDRFGQPLCRVVGIIAAVVFKIPGDGIDEDTVKKGWREENRSKARLDNQ